MLEWVWTGLRQWTGLHQWTETTLVFFSMETYVELYEYKAWALSMGTQAWAHSRVEGAQPPRCLELELPPLELRSRARSRFGVWQPSCCQPE